MVIRVLLVDDHPTMREGLRALFDVALDIIVVGEAASGREALWLVKARQPSVMLLDCRLPEMHGPAVARIIQEQGLPVQVLGLSGYDDDRLLWEMWNAGAAGYLLKSQAPEAIVNAVRAASQGKALWTSEQLARIQSWQEEVWQRWENLTVREREVLALIIEGRSNKHIAAILEVSEHTVETHVGNLLDKLEVTSPAEAITWVWRHGLDEVVGRSGGNPGKQSGGFPG